MEAATPFMFFWGGGRGEGSSLTMKYRGGNGGGEIIIHFASFTSVVSNKSESFLLLFFEILPQSQLLSICHQRTPTSPFDAKRSNFGHEMMREGGVDPWCRLVSAI